VFLPLQSHLSPLTLYTRCEIEQWFAIAHHHFLHFRNENGVIARGLRRVQPALEISQSSLQHRCSVRGAIEARPHLLGMLMRFRERA